MKKYAKDHSDLFLFTIPCQSDFFSEVNLMRSGMQGYLTGDVSGDAKAHLDKGIDINEPFLLFDNQPNPSLYI